MSSPPPSSSTNTTPVLVARDIKFYHSGGYYNNNPNDSLGGQMSSFEVVSGKLNGLFDRIRTFEADRGDVEYRCIYIRNTNPTRKLLKARIWLETTTASPKTSIAVSIGSAGMNGTEPNIQREDYNPPMNFFAIPYNMPDEPNVGDMYPGDFIGLWVRWTVDPNTESISNDWCVLRIDGEREPESLTVPTPPPPPVEGCPVNTHWNPVLQECRPITEPVTCPSGYIYDEETQSCVAPQEPPPQGCPQGYKWDPASGQCVPDTTVIVCPVGWHYDEPTQRCVPNAVNPPSVQNIKFAAVSDTVTGSSAVFSLIKSNLDTTSTSDPSFLLFGGDATHSDGNVTPFINFCKTLGTMFPSHIFPTLGNHDGPEDGASTDDDEIINAFPAMGTTGYYAITKRNIKIIVINTQADYDSGSAQHNFVIQNLQSADSDANIKWKIVMFHKPIAGSAGNHAFLSDLRDWLFPACDQYKVDFIMSGHNHVYYRTKPVKYNSSSPATPTIVVNQSTGTYTNADGRTFLGLGVGGRTTGDGFTTSSPESWVAYRRVPPPFGATFFTLQDNGTKILLEQKTVDNQTVDAVTFVKPGATVPPPTTITCPSGYHWSQEQGRCVPSPTTCPAGQHFDPVQNKCVPDVVIPPPDTSGTYPVSNVEWYYTAMTNDCLLTDRVIASGNHAPDGVLLSSGASGVDSHEILNDWLYIETGGGNGRVYWDYHTLSRYDQDDKPAFNQAMYFKFKWVGNQSVSVKDGNHGTGGYAFDGEKFFGGFGYSIQSSEIQSKVEYWHNEQGSEVASTYPGNRRMVTNKEYKVFHTFRTDRVGERVVLNVWIDFGDSGGWVQVLKDRAWTQSNWNPPGDPPDGDDHDEIVAGPSYIARTHVWLRNNNGGPDLPVTDVKIGTLNFIS